MTIKKPMKAPEAAAVPEMSPAAPGGATIADRFKLDLQDPNAKKAKTGVGTIIGLAGALLALAVSGVLTFVLYQHLEFLQGV